MILILVVLLLWTTGIVLIWRIPVCDGSDGTCSPGQLSVIIPARNEAGNLPVLLKSILEQEDPPLEVIVVDDHSEDGTADVARRNGARVLGSAPLPPGWTGKTWACHQGAAAAAGKYLLFIDSDTFFQDRGLPALLGSFHGGVLSLLPYHRIIKPHEELSAFFTISMMMGIGAFTVLGDRTSPTGLFGQSMLVEAEDYRKAGGHREVKGRILENFFMAGNFRKLGIKLHCRGGRGSLGMRMYPGGIAQLASGWSKAFVSGAASAPPLLTALTSLWMSGAVIAAIMALLAVPYGRPCWFLPYFLYSIQTWSILRRTGSFGLLTSLLYPVPLLFYFWLFFRALFMRLTRRSVTWKGRQMGSAKGRD
ncbi:MAG: glycosyltransferase [Candidatus Fermentibacteraceae bacterium]|nr:glycosyltransferase [Candidatus Fermentibacteraceae bacterium]